MRDRWLTVGPKHVHRKRTKDRAARWEAIATPLAGSTVNHRLRALSNLWTVLDGRRAPNPRARGAGSQRDAPGDARDRIRDHQTHSGRAPDRGRPVRYERRGTVSLTKLRSRVIAWTGMSPAQLMALTADAVYLGGYKSGSDGGARHVAGAAEWGKEEVTPRSQ